MIEIDGSYGEGGGQLLRTTVALAALTGQPVRVIRIRAGRKNPGLAPQHVTAVQVVAALCGAEVAGLRPRSQELTFRPFGLRGGDWSFDVGTAGSITLVLQACLPVALAAPGPVRLRVTGGTDVPWSPPADYLTEVFLPLLALLGPRPGVAVWRRGYYPRGGGIIEMEAAGEASLSALELPPDRQLGSLSGRAHVGRLPLGIAERMRAAAAQTLCSLLGVEPEIEVAELAGEEAAGTGGGLVLWAERGAARLGGSSLAERGKPAETVGREAAEELAAELGSGASLDRHAADQVLVYLAQAPGRSSFLVSEVTGHLTTMAWLLPRFLPRRVTVEPRGGLYQVTVD